jgi:hypothetical protein
LTIAPSVNVTTTVLLGGNGNGQATALDLGVCYSKNGGATTYMPNTELTGISEPSMATSSLIPYTVMGATTLSATAGDTWKMGICGQWVGTGTNYWQAQTATTNNGTTLANSGSTTAATVTGQ